MNASRSPTQELTRSLIARSSVTPEDAGCLELITARLAPLGFVCERMDGGGVSNLWARRGTARPLIVFAGHTDVVPTGPLADWHSDPFVPTERDGFLFGRGAADMKASLAAFVTSIEAFVSANPAHPGSIALLLTSDEEGDATHGTTLVVETLRAVAKPSTTASSANPPRAPPSATPSRTVAVAASPASSRSKASRATSPTRNWPGTRSTSPPRPWPNSQPKPGTKATNTSRPPPGRCPTSRPAPAPPM